MNFLMLSLLQFPNSAFFGYYSEPYGSVFSCLGFLIFIIGLVVWSFISAIKMTIEEKKRKAREAERGDTYQEVSVWKSVSLSKRRRKAARRRHRADPDI